MFLSFGRHFDLVNKRNDVIALVVVENYLLRLIHVARSKTNTKPKYNWSALFQNGRSQEFLEKWSKNPWKINSKRYLKLTIAQYLSKVGFKIIILNINKPNSIFHWDCLLNGNLRVNVIISLRFQCKEMRAVTMTYMQSANKNQSRRTGTDTQNQAPPLSDGQPKPVGKPIVVLEPGFTATPLKKLQAMDLLPLYHHYLKWVLSLLLWGRKSQTVKKIRNQWASTYHMFKTWNKKGNAMCSISVLYIFSMVWDILMSQT